MTSIDDLRHGLSSQQAKALTAFGEARGEPVRGLCAVMAVIDNRVHDGRWGHTVNEAVFAPSQFSCFLPTDLNCAPLLRIGEAWLAGRFPEDDDIVLAACLWLAAQTFRSEVGLACHYHAVRINPPDWTRPPAVRVCQIGSHYFYAGVR